MKQKWEFSLMTCDVWFWRQLNVWTNIEETHDTQENNSCRIKLQEEHLLDQHLITVFEWWVTAPGTDEDVGVVHLHLELVRHPALVHCLTIQILTSAINQSEISIVLCQPISDKYRTVSTNQQSLMSVTSELVFLVWWLVLTCPYLSRASHSLWMLRSTSLTWHKRNCKIW